MTRKSGRLVVGAIVFSMTVAVFALMSAYAADGGDVYDWLCAPQNSWIRELLKWVLPASFLASLASGYTQHMPPWLAHAVNFIAANWGDILRALTEQHPPPSATGNTAP